MSNGSVAEHLPGELLAEIASWRHHLHAHPELAFHERKTSDFVASHLAQWGYSVHRGLGGTGVVGTLVRGTGRRTIGIRADMDALPIEEDTGVAHASSHPGVMHACGHDGHVAIALGAASVCARSSHLDGTVHFIFQPAEENEGGGRRMMEDGLFRLFPCDSIYALHNWPALPVGTCVARGGEMMAALAIFEIVMTGRGCHGAMPHEGTDCILAGSHLVSALQSIVGRNVNPLQAAVVSATQIRGGDTFNVIPESCTIRGTTRWFDASIGELLEDRLRNLASSIASAFGCTAQVRYERRFPATINDPEVASLVRTVASEAPVNLRVLDAQPSMASEDFGFMLQAVPGAYLWLGAQKNDRNPGLHSSHYDFNDELLRPGVELWVSIVQRALRT